MHPDCIVHGLRTEWFYAEAFKGLDKIPHHFFASTRKARREATPESPARTFKDTLTGHII
jgi:hypothetical protein